MDGYLYKLAFSSRETECPSEIEFIIVSPDDGKRQLEAERVKRWHEDNPRRAYDDVRLSHPLAISERLYTENGFIPLDWMELQREALRQQEIRPREMGCVFRGPLTGTQEFLSAEDMADLQESIRYFMDGHRAANTFFLFVGSKWENNTRLRTEPVAIFEASSIQLASDIVQLHYLSSDRLTTLTEWCCPIYLV